MFSFHAAVSQTQFLAQFLAQLRDSTVSAAMVATVSLSLFCRGQHLAAQREISKAGKFTPVVSRKITESREALSSELRGGCS